MNNRGILIVLSGFSGAGKGTVVKNILKTYPDEYAVSVSATTRAPREGETDGREYFFKSTSEFQKMIATGELIEYAQYVGNYYGTPRRYVEEQLEAGKNIILEIEIQGAFNIKKMFPDAVLMFLMPPTAAELENRLRATQEAEGVEGYDYIVINDTVDACTQRIHEIVTSEKMKASHNLTLIEDIREDLKIYAKGE